MSNQQNKYIIELKKILIESLKDEKVKIILFGSRARGKNNFFSDVDIGIIPYSRIDERKIVLLKEEIENLNIPYKVDIVNLAEVSDKFKEEILKDAVIWKD